MNLAMVRHEVKVLNNTQAALGYQLTTSALGVSCTVFVTALYLTSYPSSWLPYLYIGFATISVVIALLLGPLLAKNNLKFFNTLQVLLILGSVFLILSLRTKFYYIPMIVSFYMMSAGALFGIISWSMTSIAFDIIEFKRLSRVLTLVNIIGSIVASFLVLVLAKIFGTITIAYFSIFLMILSIFLSLQIIPKMVPKKKIIKKARVFNYLLYRKVFVLVLFINIVATLIDYMLRLKLSGMYDSNQISQYMGILFGVSSVIAMVLTFFGIKPLLERFGILGPLFIYPFYIMITSFLVIFFPILPMITFLASSRLIFGTLYTTGRELTLNGLPDSVHTAAQYQLRSTIAPFATLLAALFILFAAKLLTFTVMASLIFTLCLIIVLYLKGLNEDYLVSLKEEMNLKRFNLDVDFDETKLKYFSTTLLALLKSPKPDLTRFALNLFSSAGFKKIPPQIMELLDSPYSDIRIDVIKKIGHFHDEASLPKLVERVEQEQDVEARWWLYQTIGIIQPAAILSRAREEAHQLSGGDSLNALHVLLLFGGIDDVIYSLQQLKKLLKEPDALVRRKVLRSLSNLNIGDFRQEIIELINDENNDVASYAIDIVAEKHLFDLMPIVIKNIRKGIYFYRARRAVLTMGAPAIPLLMNALESPETSMLQAIYLVRILAVIPSEKTEPHLIYLAKQSSYTVRNALAKSLASFSQNFNFTPDFYQQIAEVALGEAATIRGLCKINRRENRAFVNKEIEARITMLQKRFLYWLAIFTKPSEVIPLIHIIITASKNEKAKAVEVLSVICNRKGWDNIIEKVFFHKTKSTIELPLKTEKESLDPWMTKVIHYHNNFVPGVAMDNMQKVFVLRSVELFKELTAEVLYALAEQSQLLDMEKDSVIFEKGDEANGLYIVVSGTVAIYRDSEEAALLHENDFFGELGLLDDAPRSATAIAKSEGLLMLIDKDSFETLTEDFPEVLRAVMTSVLKYLRGYIQNQI